MRRIRINAKWINGIMDFWNVVLPKLQQSNIPLIPKNVALTAGLCLLLLGGDLFAEKTVRRIVPGVRLILETVPEKPWSIQVLEIDLKQKQLAFETVKALDNIVGRETTSAMSSRSNRKNRRVIAAINGDFFSTEGRTVNLQIRNGEILRPPAERSVFFIDESGKPSIDIFHLEARLTVNDSTWFPIKSVNTQRGEDALIFFNHYWGGDTGTNEFGREVRIRPLERFCVNRKLDMLVGERRLDGPAMPLHNGTYVLSGHGEAASFLENYAATGDTVQVSFDLEPGETGIVQAIGGIPRLIKNGRIQIDWREEGAKESFAFLRHPRTAIGYTAQADTVYLMTVDGRQENYSVGMTLLELATHLKNLGCTEALNLDGGGSTTMIVENQIVNRPSDAAGERPVANALLLIWLEEIKYP